MVTKLFSRFQNDDKPQARRAELMRRHETVNAKLEEALRRRSCYDSLICKKNIYAEVERCAMLANRLNQLYTRMTYVRSLPTFVPPAANYMHYTLLEEMDLASPPIVEEASLLEVLHDKDLRQLESDMILMENTLYDMQPNLPSQEEFTELTIAARALKYSPVAAAIIKTFCTHYDCEKKVLAELQETITSLEFHISNAVECFGLGPFQSLDDFAAAIMLINHRA